MKASIYGYSTQTSLGISFTVSNDFQAFSHLLIYHFSQRAYIFLNFEDRYKAHAQAMK